MMQDVSSKRSIAITIRSATKRFGATIALDNVTLEIFEREFVTLLGPSGSGKTTLLNILAGFSRSDSGAVFFGDADVTLTPPHRRNVGMVFQNYALFPHMSVGRNVGFPLVARRCDRREIEVRVDKALDLVRLSGFRRRRIDELSGGQRQRVALARAIVFEPRIVLMDEPLSALDKQLREHMQLEIRALHDLIGATTVYVTHDQREALTMSDRVSVLNHGRIVQTGTPRDLYDEPSSVFIAQFLGEAAVLPVTRACHDTVSLAGIPLRSTRQIPDSGRLVVALRYEKLLRVKEAPPLSNALRGTVKKSVFQGDSTLLEVELVQGVTIGVRHPTRSFEGETAAEPGAEVTLRIDPRDVIVLDAGNGK